MAKSLPYTHHTHAMFVDVSEKPTNPANNDMHATIELRIHQRLKTLLSFVEINFLMISSGINPVYAYNRRYQSSFLHTSTLQLRNCYCGIRVGFMKKHTSFKLVAASVQPVGDSKLGQFDNTLPSEEILELWRNADAVCFDVDSTVCIDEGIDELAEFCGAGKAVAEWTARAMGGSVPFEDALAARLSLFNPSLSQVQNFLVRRPPMYESLSRHLSVFLYMYLFNVFVYVDYIAGVIWMLRSTIDYPIFSSCLRCPCESETGLSSGIEELIGKLKANQIQVYLISGGFRQMINPVASILGIPHENIFANQLLFGNSGEFLGFDKNEPTSRSGGKATAVQQIRKARQYKSLVMVGDGATDLEARRPGGADLFICYAGIQLRESVAANADWLVFNFNDLINSLG
ncbi:hypothetical protein L6164_011245 [Bauhinia variegata]|uniref:Uncharacterized protein n=1 Tax=Bauhinia variegata TaxID=167791 RepID=A0ACB9P5B2_BAUVA|nr:hypothetical protein L6164_011245 [Bauhinia variegata]